MSGTPTRVDAEFKRLMAERSPEERVMMAFEMYSFAKEIARAAIRQRQPDISEAALRREVFLHFYRHDLPSDTLAYFLRWIDEHESGASAHP